MIKKQEQSSQSLPTELYCCLNPYCFQSQQRLFPIDHSHFSQQHCKKWIIDHQEFTQFRIKPYDIKQLQSLQLNFDREPLKALQKLQRLKISQWTEWLNSEQARIKKNIINAIQTEFEAIHTKTSQLIQKSTIIFDLRQLVSSSANPSNLINESYRQTKPNFQEMSNYILFKRGQLKQRIKSIKAEIEKVYTCMMQNSKPANNLLTHAEQRNLHQYIWETVDQYYNKLQVIASVLGKKVTSYSVLSETISLECIICERKTSSLINPTNKKTVKKYLAQQILNHLYCDHYEEIGFAYSRKIAKTHLIDIKYQSFLQQSKHYQIIRIIDRQSGVTSEQSYEQYKQNSLIYTVEVVSLKNFHMAKGKHILVSTHQSIDFMITIMAHTCTQRDQTVQIKSNKESLKCGIRELLYLKPETKTVKKQKEQQPRVKLQ